MIHSSLLLEGNFYFLGKGFKERDTLMTNTFQALDKDSKFSSLKNISKTVDIIYKLALSTTTMLKIFFPKETFLEAFGEIFWYVQGHVRKINLQDNPPPLSRFWIGKKILSFKNLPSKVFPRCLIHFLPTQTPIVLLLLHLKRNLSI